MTRRKKIVRASLALLALGLAAFAVLISRDAPCGSAPPSASGANAMQAATYRCYGAPEVVAVEQLEKPTPAEDEVLVRVRAASINPLDWHLVRGKPYIMRLDGGFGLPKNPRFGVDFAGTVEAVGSQVTRFKPGDAVFGGKRGALAEYVAFKQERAVVAKPDNIDFDQAAAVPVAGVTALQALRDGGQLRPGQKVLINGASGGVGTFAVQIAKALGAEVTGVCSTRNVELVRSLGADHVVDYTKDDFTTGATKYDLIIDNVANRDLLDIRRVMTAKGTYVLVGGGGPERDGWIGPFSGMIKAKLLSFFVDQTLKFFLAEITQADLNLLGDMMKDGRVKPVVDRRYPLADVVEAMRYLESGRARGKVIVNP